MTKDEFNDWYADYCAAYPGTDEFVNKSKAGKATLAHWLAILSDCELADALEVTKRMLRGEDDEVKAFDRHTTPRHVADLCRAMRRRRMQGTSEPFEPEFQRSERRVDWSCGDVLRKLRDCAATGGALHSIAQGLMPVNEENEPRFRCLDCRDRGMVTCWHPATMRMAREGALTLSRACYLCAVVCHCEAGRRYESLSKGGWNSVLKKYNRETPIFYDADKWLRCDGVNEDSLAELIAFMADYRPPNYERAFDAYNVAP